MTTSAEKLEILSDVARRININISNTLSENTRIRTLKSINVTNLAATASAAAVGGAVGTGTGLAIGLAVGSLILPGIGTVIGMTAAGALSHILNKNSIQDEVKEVLNQILSAVKNDTVLDNDISEILDTNIKHDRVIDIKKSFVELRIMIELTNLQNYLKNDANHQTMESFKVLKNYPSYDSQALTYCFNNIEKILQGYPHFQEIIGSIKKYIKLEDELG
ncbi:MAG: hypothetical protein QNJ33_03455 [Crocosphaera sp.]|nr:hypothetical protein [Crocosphaera sp.]